jgi:cell shape-determining protein MreC
MDIQSNVQVGDRVVTSGYSEFIPAGIPIGRVVQIHNDLEFGTKRCQVFPNVQIGDVREVAILR